MFRLNTRSSPVAASAAGRTAAARVSCSAIRARSPAALALSPGQGRRLASCPDCRLDGLGGLISWCAEVGRQGARARRAGIPGRTARPGYGDGVLLDRTRLLGFPFDHRPVGFLRSEGCRLCRGS
jgi:hypothetical protein